MMLGRSCAGPYPSNTCKVAQIGDDEADSREQFPEVELHLRHHPSRRFPTRRLVQKALVPDHWFMTGADQGTLQQFRNVPLQILEGLEERGVKYAIRIPSLGI